MVIQPMSDTEFIGQMAQFSTLEQMQQMTQMFSYTQAYSLVGKNITASVTDDSGATQQLTGNVDSVITYNGEPYLMVAGYMLPLSTPMSVNGTGSADSLLQGASLIGRTVTGYYLDEDNAVQKVTGQVTKAALVNGELTLTVNGIAVNINNVTEIADGSDTNAG